MCFKEKMKDILILLVLLIAQLTKVCPQPYQADSDGRCRNSSREYLSEESNLCCSKCPPGQRLVQECSGTIDSVCKACEPEQFMETWNYNHNCFSCSKCSSSKGLLYAQNCSATTRSKCICQPGMYCYMGFDDPYCTHCGKYTLCKAGHGVSMKGKPNSNVKCKACISGTFSDTESYTEQCRNHTKCSGRTLRNGTTTSDTVCELEPFISITQAQTSTKEPLQKTALMNASSVSNTPITHPTTAGGLTDSTHTISTSVPGTEDPSKNQTSVPIIAGVTGGIILLFFTVCLLFFCKPIWKKDAARLYPKVDANGNCEKADHTNQGYSEEAQLTSFTVPSPEQQCLLEKGEASSSDHSQCSNNTETLTRTEGCSSYESNGHLQSTIALNNSFSPLSEPQPLISNTETVTPQPSVLTQSSSQPTSPQIISPVTTSPHVNVNITFHIGNGSCGAQPVIPTDLIQADCTLPFGEEDESFSIPQQEDGKQSLMSVQESASYRV